MAYFVILNFDIEDAGTFRTYEQLARPTLPATAKVLIFDDDPEQLEGHSHRRLVVLEFESRAAALAWYQSEPYQNAAKHRRAATTGWVRGVPGLAVRLGSATSPGSGAPGSDTRDSEAPAPKLQ